MSNLKGSRRDPVTGVGSPDDNERWFRMYGADVFTEISHLSARAALHYLRLLATAYSHLGDVHEARCVYSDNWMSKQARRKAMAELEDAGLVWRDGANIRVRHYDPRNHGFAIQRKPIPAEVRAAVYERDGNACVYCGATDRLTLDHVIPVSRCGSDDMDNLVCACLACNISKGRRAPGGGS